MQQTKPKVLFFANIPIPYKKRTLGGATVLAKNILDYLNSSDQITIKHVQIRRFWTPKLQLIDYFRWIFRFPFLLRKIDVVSIHATQDFHITIAPILYLWCRLLNKKLVYHFFAGNFHEQYNTAPKFLKPILENTILKSDFLFFETKELIRFFENKGFKGIWLPNPRPRRYSEIKFKPYQKRLVFISRVVPEKGIKEIVDAVNTLPSDYTIDIYGPIESSYNEEFTSFLNERIRYKGILSHDKVLDTLERYDVNILPTFADGEGYPGIIIESLSLGIPSISTYFRTIPEIIGNGFNGLLINIKDSQKLTEAILSIDEQNFTQYRQNAFSSFKEFESEIVFKRFIDAYLCSLKD